MKKLALATVCAFAVSGIAFGQGNVNWGSISFTQMTAETNSATSPLFGGSGTGGTVGATQGAASLGTGYYYELLYSAYGGSQATIPSLSSLLSWHDAGLTATNNPVTAGWLAPVAGNTQATVPWAAGTTDSIVMVGWSANLGTSWGVVSNLLATSTTFASGSFLGVSTTGYIAPNSANPGVSVFAGGAATYGLPIHSLNTQLYSLPTAAIPEPATMALTGLGGLSLLLFRRQRK